MSVNLMNSIMQGYQKSQNRVMAIKAARDDKRQKDETYELDKKIKLQKIDQAEMMGGLDKGAAENERKRQKIESNLLDAQSEMNDALIEDALTKETEAQKSMKSIGEKVAQSLMPGIQRVYTPGKGFSNVRIPQAKPAGTAVSAADKVLGTINSGGVMKDGELQPFEDKQTVEAYASQNLGADWEQKYPKARNMIDLNFGGMDILPKDMKKTSEALKYLVEERGMTQPQAAQWLRRNNQKKIKV